MRWKIFQTNSPDDVPGQAVEAYSGLVAIEVCSIIERQISFLNLPVTNLIPDWKGLGA